MAKFKNAIRKHYIAAYDPEHPDTAPTEDKYMWIAKGVKETSPENDEEDDEVAYFDGDGTKEKMITSKSRGRSFEGHREYGDKAQDFIADKEDALADDLVVWYKEVVPTGEYYKEGLGRLSGVEIGEGEAHELESIKFQINWSRKPEKHDITSAPAGRATSISGSTGSTGITGTPAVTSSSSSDTSSPSSVG